VSELRRRLGEALADFERIETYPGTRTPIPDRPGPAETVAEPKERKPLRYSVAGKPMEFVTIGDLAAALGRSAVTLRRWETQGILPRAKYRAPGAVRQKARRLYTVEQRDAIVRIAEEEGLLSSRRPPIESTKFTERVQPYFKLEERK
jgi:MerR-like DNA binding protein